MPATRRQFTRALTGSAAALTLAGCRPAAARPNILWITSEDNGPFLGCYGDSYADTPNLDRLAAESILYERAYAAYPVCAPARSTLITGVWANSLGTGHMRSSVPIPASIRLLPALLREAGYYCANNSKEDYNTRTPADAWDESSREASYRNRRPGQPFFHVVNLTTTHESSLFKPGELRHDPAAAPIPPYHPDDPVFRRDWAHYYDNVTRMDAQVGEILAQLQADGLDQDTIVFYFSDHGGVLPRTKRYLYDSGLRVPLLVRFPERLRHLAPAPPGARTPRPVTFVDFAPSVLGLAGTPVPEYMQGVPFLGPDASRWRKHVFAARDRMGPCPDLSRAATDGRFKYIRNYLPHLPPSQLENYTLAMASWRRIEELGRSGGLTAVQGRIFEPKPAEELYDTEQDPHEVVNLAAQPEFADTLARMREALRSWVTAIRDTGFMPEIEMHRLAAGSTPYELARDKAAYPLDRILRVAELAGSGDPASAPALGHYLEDDNTVVQFWAAAGCGNLGEAAMPVLDALKKAVRQSPSPAVRIEAASALCRCGEAAEALDCITGYLEDADPWVRFTAATALDRLNDLARPAAAALRRAADDPEEYPRLVARHALAALE